MSASAGEVRSAAEREVGRGCGKVVVVHRVSASVLALVLAAAIGLAAPVPPAGAATGVRSVAAGAGVSARSELVGFQRHLNQLGCDAGHPDGVLDAHMRDAVRRFQSRHGRAMTGRLDKATKRLLRGSSTVRCDRRPVPRHSGTGRRIVVSQHQDWIWLVRADGSVAAQAGMVDAPRVLAPGHYATGSYCGRAARIAENTDLTGRYWLDHFVRFAPCGIGFHRVPRLKSTGRQIHPDWVLGTDQATSDGCLRLSQAVAGRVWRFTSRRTQVRVLR